MNKNIPTFEINGKTYEIRRTRYLMAEFDKRKNQLDMASDEDSKYEKQKNKLESLQKLAERKSELYDIYLTTFDDNDERLYNKCCEAYDKLYEEIKGLDNVIGEKQKALIDMSESLIIEALTRNENGEEIRTKEEANNIWCDYVVEIGKQTATEFVIYTINYILGIDNDDENPFLSQAKAKAEQRKANMRKGLQKIK
jgi:hypothetical protein